MSNLYELTKNYDTVLNMLYDEEIDEQCIFDTLESIEGELEDKADGYAKLMRELECVATIQKAESERLTRKARILENRAKVLKQNLYNAMKTTGKTKFATKLFNFNIAKNGGKQTLTIDGEVPEEYTKSKVENDTEKIREVLEAGKELSFAHLEPRGESLRIK